MRPCARPALTVALVASAALLTGCLDREEKVVVLPGGGAVVTHVLRGDAGDFEPGGDALPTGAPWQVTDEDVPKPDGKGVDHVRRARIEVPSLEALPASFGAPDDPTPLHARTALRIEPLAEGRSRYVFERRYVPRAWAWRARLERDAIPPALKKALDDAGGGPLPDDLLRQAIVAALRLERGKGAEQVEAALVAAATAVGGAAPGPATRLAARSAFERRFDAAWRPDDLMPVLREGAEALKALEARYRAASAADAVTSIREALAAAGDASPDLEARAQAAFAVERRTLEATEDLRDESFCVRVTLPVPVVEHDGEALEDDGHTVVFRFHGEDLYDREQVLRVVGEGRP